jgi:hypothetical protein
VQYPDDDAYDLVETFIKTYARQTPAATSPALEPRPELITSNGHQNGLGDALTTALTED